MNILAGLDAIFDRHLGVEDIGESSPHHRYRTSALRLSGGRPVGFNAGQLLREAYARLLLNLESSPRFARSGASQENWRFRKQLGDSPHNPSPEVTLERAIVRAMGDDWCNQVPAASGLWNAVADKRRAVDLVCRVEGQSFELIELKVESDTPLRAAVEIVQYGLLYALARDRYPDTVQAGKDLLHATAVHLRVLAPADYYAPYALGWLEHDFNIGLRTLAAERFGEPLLASFSFHAFPSGFCWPCPLDALVEQMGQRRCVWLAKPDVLVAERSDGPTPPSGISEPSGATREAGPAGDSTMNLAGGFAERLKRHLISWATTNDLAGCVELEMRRPWVFAEAHRMRNLFRQEWWHHIQGLEHRWVRALNSSQCFAVNLFATLAEDRSGANRFLRRMLPDRGITDADHVVVRFEHSPRGVPERLGERGQPTQIDVFFEVVRADRICGAIGVEVKLSESEFGGCRGWNGVGGTGPINPDRKRCLNARRVVESPDTECFMAEREGRRYWNLMGAVGTSFVPQRLAEQDRCPFRHGLYQMMRNRVALDVFRSITDAEWTDFVVCVILQTKRSPVCRSR